MHHKSKLALITVRALAFQTVLDWTGRTSHSLNAVEDGRMRGRADYRAAPTICKRLFIRTGWERGRIYVRINFSRAGAILKTGQAHTLLSAGLTSAWVVVIVEHEERKTVLHTELSGFRIRKRGGQRKGSEVESRKTLGAARAIVLRTAEEKSASGWERD